MKTAILNPKAQFLLGAGLDILHFESKEWLETIAFWKDEIRFFENLLNKKAAFENTKSEFTNMLKNLDKIHLDLFEDLKDSIVEHERLLSRIVKGEKGVSDAHYREKHHNLFLRINTFKSDFKAYKQIIFDYSKNL